MPDYLYPTVAELIQVAQDKMPNLTEDRAAFQILPITTANQALLLWEVKDNWGGLQAVRGIDGAPSRVKAVGGKLFMAEPGYYGEFMPIDELQLTMRRQATPAGQMVNIEDLTMERQDQLLERRLNRIEYIIWQLVLNGTFAVARNNIVMHTDTFAIQTYTRAVDWSDTANATPIADLRAVKLLSRGTSANFGRAATLRLNQVEANNLMQNRNEDDLYGTRKTFGATIDSMDSINTLLVAEDLPKIDVYDEGYFANDDGTGWTQWIPDGKASLVGARPAGQTIGEYRMTINANNEDMIAGPYMKVIDHVNDVPRTIEVHDGHNGAPLLYYPGSLVRMNI